MLSEYRQHCTDIETTTWNMFHCFAAGITAGIMLRTLDFDIKALTDSTVGAILDACRYRGFLFKKFLWRGKPIIMIPAIPMKIHS
jgi:hypothetical protein